ncbi:MAG TPA: HDOD domain-containing protein, partial [Sedimentisphaerales bacterium]|nr:HDOD domain-containing protein [Sedimentisphaerales bacterium]
GSESSGLLSRKNLARHSLGVACCARGLAEFCLEGSDRLLAFPAGLLHDIGKLAIEDVMPKSFEKIVASARRQGVSSCDIEQVHLGLDHAVIGRRLAQRLHAPEEIATAIWLHHSPHELIADNMPAAKIAPIVRLADAIVRQSAIGDSGSYDGPAETIAEMSEYLGLSAEQVSAVRSGLPSEVARRAQLLGLEDRGAAAAYCDAVKSAAVQLSGDVTRLASENKRLASGATIFDFTEEFFESINSASSPVEIAAGFAKRWQEFFQTGPVCVCLPDPLQTDLCNIVTFSRDGESDSGLAKCPDGLAVIPPALQKSFLVADAMQMAWLVPQVDLQWDASRLRIAPLMAGDKAVAVLVFEQRYVPASTDYLKTFEEISSIAGGVLAMAASRQQYQEMAERFVLLAGRLRQAQKTITDANALVSLAEMASGAAHELNTPLAVISGRAQLLLDSESDLQKKQSLQQIIERSEEISQIVKDLLEFAEPSAPRPVVVDVKTLLDEAKSQAAAALNLGRIEIYVNCPDGAPEVLVDPSQVAPAIANIIVNSQQAYPEGAGPVTATVSVDEQGGLMSIDIIDGAAGMSPEVLAKATQPFFSAKPAGRRRGMGLANSKRLIQLNGGTLAIASELGAGTTVSIGLPLAKVQ